MRKKGNYKKRPYPIDPKYQDPLVGKLTNHLMKKGKKSLAQKIIYQSFEYLEKNYKEDPLAVFESALKNVAPSIEVKSKRVGGANYQVPMPVRGERKDTLAMRWILQACRSKRGKPMYQKLADELVLASKNEGAAVKKRMDIERMAEANKAFAHFAS